MKTHISKVISSCYHQLRRIGHVRRLIGQDVDQLLVSAFRLSRLDYCNSLLSRLPWSTSQPVARVIMNLSVYVTIITRALKEPHWLPVEQRITYNSVYLKPTSIIRYPASEPTRELVRELVADLLASY